MQREILWLTVDEWQVAAAVVTAVVTIALVAVTYAYVRRTGDMVGVMQQQSALQHEVFMRQLLESAPSFWFEKERDEDDWVITFRNVGPSVAHDVHLGDSDYEWESNIDAFGRIASGHQRHLRLTRTAATPSEATGSPWIDLVFYDRFKNAWIQNSDEGPPELLEEM
jgi:hypothetical protein